MRDLLSTYELLRLENAQPVITIFVAVTLALALAPWFGGKKVAGIEIPTVQGGQRVFCLFFATPALALLVGAFLPIWASSPQETSRSSPGGPYDFVRAAQGNEFRGSFTVDASCNVTGAYSYVAAPGYGTTEPGKSGSGTISGKLAGNVMTIFYGEQQGEYRYAGPWYWTVAPSGQTIEISGAYVSSSLIEVSPKVRFQPGLELCDHQDG